MADFHGTILKAISDYKAILRKNLPAVERTTKMYKLGIKRKSVKGLNEVGLYEIGLRIVKELKKDIGVGRAKKSNNFYFGAKEFLQYLERFLSEYRAEGNKVVHVRQKASCALMDAIQLVKFSKGVLGGDDMFRIKKCIDVIAVYGDERQKKIFVDTVNNQQSSLVKFLPEEFTKLKNISCS